MVLKAKYYLTLIVAEFSTEIFILLKIEIKTWRRFTVYVLQNIYNWNFPDKLNLKFVWTKSDYLISINQLLGDSRFFNLALISCFSNMYKVLKWIVILPL